MNATTQIGMNYFTRRHPDARVVPHDATAIPGGPSIADFEALVRDEWRRRLGPSSDGRPHRAGLIRALGLRMRAGGSTGARLEEELEWVIADRSRSGADTRTIRRELVVLVRSVWAVLSQTDVNPGTTRRAVTPLRATLKSARFLPAPQKVRRVGLSAL